MHLDAWRSAPPAHPHRLRRWITGRGSLTEAIIADFENFNLVRLQQTVARPHRDERRELALRAHALAVTREVLLRDGDRALVFAHSVAARDDLRGAWRGLSRLGSRPLAEMLFRDPTVVRLPMEYRKIDHRHPLFVRAREVADFTAQTLWARRSVFIKKSRPLLVTEVFLPAMAA
jgi:chorismate lyase